MKNLSAVLVVLLCLPVLRVFGDDPIGKVEDLTGTATAQGASGEARGLAKDAPVFLNDRVTTGPASKLLIRFADNTIVGQGENAELVINRYVYAPGDRGANDAAFRLVKGVFRFLTDQITKLNPEHFEVQANYGTIGIRGCELAFNLLADRDDVLVVSLSGKENILFNLNEDPGGGRPTTLLIREAGIAVTMSRLEGFGQRRFEPGELQFFNFVFPKDSSRGENGGDDTDWGETDEPATSPGHDLSEEQGPDGKAPSPGENQSDVNDVVDETQFDQQRQDAQTVLEDADGNPVSDEDSGAPPTTDENPPRGGGDGSGGGTPPANQIVSVGPSVDVASGSGLDWSWGIWSRRVVYVDASGTEQTTVRYKHSTNGRNLDPADALAIATGNIRYSLRGAGDAGATVVRGDRSAVLDGTASIAVDIGQGISPTWFGDFGLQDTSGNSLQFKVNGVIGPDGDLQSPPGGPSSYNINALGFQSSTAPAGSHIGGNLVGPGTGPNPISGAVVDFSFDHGAGNPVVHGVGGADLR